METSPYGLAALWAQSDVVIRAVALVLLAMSVACWSILALRVLELVGHRRAARATQHFWHQKDFDAGLNVLGRSPHNLFRELAEQARSARNHHQTHHNDLHGQLPLSEWLASCLRGAVDEHLERVQRGLPMLASIGSTAPFIGLFGTVWGIYHALIGIGATGNVDIGQIAGPVGEALIMTAFGLAVAIPAVLAFNALTRQNRLLLGRMNRFAHDLQALFVMGDAPVRTSVRLVSDANTSTHGQV